MAPSALGPDSPCNKACVMDEEQGLCRGCARTVGEIAAWGSASDEFRASVWAALADRRAARGVRDDLGADVP